MFICLLLSIGLLDWNNEFVSYTEMYDVNFIIVLLYVLDRSHNSKVSNENNDN